MRQFLQNGPGWSWIWDLPSSAFWVLGFTAVCHHTRIKLLNIPRAPLGHTQLLLIQVMAPLLYYLSLIYGKLDIQVACLRSHWAEVCFGAGMQLMVGNRAERHCLLALFSLACLSSSNVNKSTSQLSEFLKTWGQRKESVQWFPFGF